MGNAMASRRAQSTREVESVGGKSMIGITWFLENKILWSIGEAERLKGSAPITAEIHIVFFRHYTTYFPSGWISAFMNNLYREDKFYASKDMLHFSLTGPDGTEERKMYETYSERFRRIYPGYMLDKKMHVVAAPNTPVVNLKQLVALLKSKDAEEWER